MEIFLRNLPPKCNEQRLKNTLRDPLKELGIRAFDVTVYRNKGIGTLTVSEQEFGQRILNKYGFSANPRMRNRGPNDVVRASGKPIQFALSRNAPDKHSIRALKESQKKIIQEEARQAATQDVSNEREKKFDVQGVECGVWQMREDKIPIFNSYYKLDKDGQIIFGRDGVRVMIYETPEDGLEDLELQKSYMILIPYFTMQAVSVVTYGQPQVTFTLGVAPRFYSMESGGLMAAFSLAGGPQLRDLRTRKSSIDADHAVVAAFCFVYRFPLPSFEVIYNLQLLGKHKGVPPIEPINTSYSSGYENFVGPFMKLLSEVPSFPFPVAFQLTALFANGIVPPDILYALLPRIKKLLSEDNTVEKKNTASILQQFYQELPYQNPLDRQTAFSEKRLQTDLEECANRFRRQQAARRKDNRLPLKDAREEDGKLAFIHHAVITPAGCYFDGPKPETQNRVLRKYADKQDHFLRVTFAEEDGETLTYEKDVNQELIYRRFREYMIKTADGEGGKLLIGGRVFSFLGFSGASLRSHTCWFMAPFEHEGEYIDATALIAKLGDFSHITTPGKCAARIGQAFSNTYKSVEVPQASEIRISDVERNGRCFSDGCGTISVEMIDRIWQNDRSIAQGLAFVFQIRFAGAKGVVSLDTKLQGDILCLRPSMVKFEGSDSRHIEICSSAQRPLPMYLNRPLIKILEDLGVDDRTFLALQADEVKKLRDASHTPSLAANFMERRSIGIKSLKLPWLIKALDNLGLSFQEDVFLGQAFELALLTALRDIKYRARIQIPKGFTVMGIMDEYGVLEEGEVFCHIDDNGKRSILTGEIVITRAPAMHPGDVQVCRAVMVPDACPLYGLRNCVVFSQKGDRDLPSQLSGGDLDGDLYNLIFDARFRPKRIHVAADYPRVKGKDLGRPVNTEDMVDFLIDFMQNDRLGLISTRHLIIADQQKEGTFHSDCIKLAQMHSTAVDFPKTGVKVEMTQLPRCGRTRPDFMAPGPQLFVEKVTQYSEERDPRDDENNDDEYGNVPTRYYESEKILGKLYRTIDERRFKSEIKEESDRNLNLILDVWDYIVGFVRDEEHPINLPWQEYAEFAENLKAEYEDDVRAMMRDYSVTPTAEPLKEVEVFIGCIVGKGKQNKREKDNSVQMKEGFDRVVDRVFECIRGSSDEFFESGPWEVLAKGMACLWACVNQRQGVSRRRGEGTLQSFGWIAASATLQEVNTIQKKRKQAKSERGRMRGRNGPVLGRGGLGVIRNGLRN
ncbi:RNA dependent RNA polymerase-domain-containing protein [Tirmania nivea]|nr:RNA dependent RNA polymerase-domain-containing protein [Tirmania nivea]